MSLPGQDVLDDIKELITEITGFQENDENFTICERYCLSHVVHHMYPFVNRTTVKSLVNSYVTRFYGHGYFKVSQELNTQVKSFLSNTKLFEKNPQFDIQWSLLSLLCSLSSNLTSLKKLPQLLPTDDEETKTEDFNWKEYLLSDLPQYESQAVSSDDLSRDYTDESEDTDEDTTNNNKNNNEESEEDETNRSEKSLSVKECGQKSMQVIFDNRTSFNSESSISDGMKAIEELIERRRLERGVQKDLRCRGNISEAFDKLMNQEGIIRKTQLMSEIELLESILFQFQTGEKILLQKGYTSPTLTSLTQETLGSYLESLQPYFEIIREFKNFDAEVIEAKYKFPDNSSCSVEDANISLVETRRKVPNVLFIYNVMLQNALEPFQNEVTKIVENLENHTLLQMEQKLRVYYFDLTTLYHVHILATKNWNKDCNWMSSIRILTVLYNAIMETTSIKMSFVFLNLFLHCFKVYLDIIDTWISFVDLIDPCEEFIIAKSVAKEKSENECSEYEIRPYKTQTEIGGRQMAILDFIAEKMIHVGQSLEVLRRLGRFVLQEAEPPTESSHQLLIKTIREKVRTLERTESVEKEIKPKEKKKSIFTIKNIGLGLERDNGAGDSLEIGNLLAEIIKEDEKKDEESTETTQSEPETETRSYCGEVIYSMVTNPFLRNAFKNIGMKQVQLKLEEARAREKDDAEQKELMAIQTPEKGKSGVYPLHKIITEAVHLTLGNRVMGAWTQVKDIVLKECGLLKHLSLLQSVLLYNDSYIIQPFVIALFTQPIIWGSSYSLTLHLRECVKNLYKDYANSLSVIITKRNSVQGDNILEVIDAITVNYEVKWPLTLFITPEALVKYNEIFRLALKLNWAHWALCNLHFQESDTPETKTNSKSVQHRFQLLRFWLLSALGRIINYFFAQMTPLDLRLNSCEDLKEIINGHSEFLDKIHTNCLLGEKLPEGRKLILETLIPLCEELLQEGGVINETKLSSIEKTFGSCHLRLSHVLSSLEK